MIAAGVFVLLTYMVASIPTGPILATLYADVDVTQQGSGNIGATNVYRALGPRFGVATLTGDILKGLLPVLLSGLVSDHIWFPSLVGLVAFIGHCWPAYLEFRGGKGVATVAGVLLGLAPFVALLTAGVWMLIFLTIRRSSVAALMATLSLPLFTVWLRADLIWVTMALVVGVLQRHRSNIHRILPGDEPVVEHAKPYVHSSTSVQTDDSPSM